MRKIIFFAVTMSIGTLVISCSKPTYECACTSSTTTDKYNTLASQYYEEDDAEDWCKSIETDTSGFTCRINEVKK